MAKEKYTGNAKQTWEQWSIKQRKHFLKDHSFSLLQAVTDEFSELSLKIQKSVKQHLKGKYEQGGNVNVSKTEYVGDLRGYQKRISENFKYMHTNQKDWKATPIIGFITQINEKGKEAFLPQFDFPSGYKKANTMFDGKETCELCGKHPVKIFYHLQNDVERQTLSVGSECVTHFEDGRSGKENAKQFKLNQAKKLVKHVREVLTIIKETYFKDKQWHSSLIDYGNETADFAVRITEGFKHLRPNMLFNPKTSEKNRIYWKWVFDKMPAFIGDIESAEEEKNLLSWYTKNEKKLREMLPEVISAINIINPDFVVEQFENGGNINSYATGDEVKFYYGKEKEVKQGVITDKTRDEKNFIVTAGTSQIKVEPGNIIEKVESKKKKKVFGVFKGGGNIWGTDPEAAWNGWSQEQRRAFLEYIKNVNARNIITLRSKYSELLPEIQNAISEYVSEEEPEKRSSKQIEKEISELESEIKKQDEDIARYVKNMEETQAARTALLEQLNEIKCSNNEPNKLMPWQKELTPEEIEFIISAINRYGKGAHPKASLNNWEQFSFNYVRSVLYEIKDTSHLSDVGLNVKKAFFKKLNIDTGGWLAQ